MGLREQAAADLKGILEDSAAGFGWPITVRDPAGNSANLTGFSGDVAQVIDPQTGIAVSGRLAHVALALASLRAAGFEDLPRSIAEEASRPWVVIFNDIEGSSHTFKVRECNPDRTLGLVTCTLESYRDG